MYRETLTYGLVLGASAPLLLANPAAADFTKLTIEQFSLDTWRANGYAGLTTYRLYAEFDGQSNDDGVVACFGVADIPMRGQSSDQRNFYNASDAFDSNTAPVDLTGIGVWENQWDTYVTIGTDTAADDDTFLSPGFGTETGNLARNWQSDDVGWLTPFDEQGRAVDGRVLIAQFTVAEGENVSGVVGLLLLDGSAVPSPLSFNSCIASPPEDLDGSGDVETGDILAVLVAWSRQCRGPLVLCECERCDDPCSADLDGSGVVDFLDLLQLFAEWGNSGPEDLNCNGRVDTFDLLILLGFWGTVCA